jgi:hypothetical protein
MTQSYEEVREGSVPPDEATPESSAQTRAHAREQQSVVADAVTQSARAAWRFTMASAAAADRAGSLPDAQPKTLRQARAWHHRCAGHYQAAAMRWPRLVWGYVHMTLIVPALRSAEWVTESPARSLVAAVILTAAWFGR